MRASVYDCRSADPNTLREKELLTLRNTRPFNMLGLPTVSVPCGFTRADYRLECRLLVHLAVRQRFSVSPTLTSKPRNGTNVNRIWTERRFEMNLHNFFAELSGAMFIR